MAPRKKTPNMVWVGVKSKQPAKTTTEKKTSSVMSLSDSVSKLQLSSKVNTFSAWSLLPEELLHIISAKLEDCYDFIHARSVCRPWRSIFPFPSSLLRTRYSLPSFDKFPRKGRKGFCTLEKFPVLFRVRTPHHGLPSEFYVGGIRPDNSEVEFPSPVQCSVKIPNSASTFLNIVDCQWRGYSSSQRRKRVRRAHRPLS
ncbi:unnamed protein product [Eruca vesicaria subsp. sativa]|uniref:F-box domain-containing protein n=1 Tax=Eruca vesicaria subsp. sativa TaxID=29727 RepID=A0ABC8J640_ERUVS|nr:unnamed protein product [Eruca vesicaria subsp. sativa]